MTSLLLFTFSIGLSHATLTPHRLHWCAGLFATRPADVSQVASDTLALNEMNARVDEARRPLNDPKIGGTMRKMRRMIGFLLSDDGKRIDFAIKDLGQPKQLHRSIWEIDALAERLRRIEHAATRLEEDTISFGHVVRGREAIDAYADSIATEARRLDAADVLNVNPKYRLNIRWIAPLAVGAMRASIAYIVAGATAQLYTQDNYTMAVVGLLATTYWGKGVVSAIREVISYVRGLRSAAAREYHVNTYEPGRDYDYAKRLSKVSKVALDGPRPLAHSSIALTTTSDKIDGMLAASGRPVRRPDAPTTSGDDENPVVITPDQRRVLIDFVSYRDDEGEPVVITFVRIVRVNLGGRKRTPPRADARPSAPVGWPGSVAPVGMRAAP